MLIQSFIAHKYFTHYFSLSLSSEIFLVFHSLQAYLFKSGDAAVASNYRPVSLLPILSKVLERVVQQRLVEHIKDHNLLPQEQFAYRKAHSTEDALVYASDRYLAARDKGLHTGVVLVDLSKAFDKVHHETLIADLFSMGVHGTALNWFRNYLTDRQQVVTVRGAQPTKPVKCTCGVPQGSVLGPILFALYTRNVPDIIEAQGAVCQIYADDILFDYSSRSLSTISNCLSDTVSALANWLSNRHLILNSKKTKVLCISSSSRSTANIQVTCNGQQLEQTASARYLGVILDDKLSWTPHVDHVVGKVSSKLRAFWRVRQMLSLFAAKLFFQSVILNDILYASNAFYSGLSITDLDRIIRLSKSAVRCVMLAEPYAHSLPLFQALSIAPMSQQANRKLQVLAYRCLNSLASQLLCSRFLTLRRESRHASITTRGRSAGNLLYPSCNTQSGLRRPVSASALLWNSLPTSVHCLPTIAAFAKALLD